MTDAPKGLPVSVQVRLVQHAKATGIDPNVVLARYAAERFLYRLSRSRSARSSKSIRAAHQQRIADRVLQVTWGLSIPPFSCATPRLFRVGSIR